MTLTQAGRINIDALAEGIQALTRCSAEDAHARAERQRDDDIAASVTDGREDAARERWGDEAVDDYFRRDGVDPDAERIDFDELTKRLEAIGDDVQRLAESIGLPDPGAADTEDLVREMWAKVHAHDAAAGVHVDEGRALGWHA